MISKSHVETVERIIHISDHPNYITGLIEAGALQANYLSLQLEQRLREAGAHQDFTCNCVKIFLACDNQLYEQD